jgi:hypothetical protein
MAEGFPQRHSLVLDEVGEAQGGRAAHPRHAVYQRLATHRPHLQAHHVISTIEYDFDVEIHSIVLISILIKFLTNSFAPWSRVFLVKQMRS